jgi:predicted metalloendopeptidase
MPIKTKKSKKMTHKHKLTLKNNIEKNLLLNLNLNERTLVCGTTSNEYNSFESSFIKNVSFEKSLFKYLSHPETIKQNDNFYNYVNQKLIVAHNDNNPAYIIQNDNFRKIQDKVYHQMIDIYKEYIKTNSSKETINMKNLFESAISLNSIKSSKTYITNIINNIDELRKDKSNLWKILAMINKNPIISTYSPILFEVHPDKKNSDKYCCYIYPQNFVIDLGVFTKDKTFKCNCKSRYIKYLHQLFETCLGKKHNQNIDHLFKCFEKIFFCFSGEEFVNDENNYNKVLKSESLEKYNFNWDELSREIGIKNIPDFFITPDLNYLKNVSTLLSDEWHTEEWRPFWIYIYIRQISRYTHTWKEVSTSYYLKFLEHSSIYDVEIYAIRIVLKAFNKILSELYVQKYYNADTFNYVTNMSNDLKMVLYNIIKQNKWMTSKTRNYALKKIENLKIIIGSTLTISNDYDIYYNNSELWQNLLNFSSMKFNQFLMLIGENVIDLNKNNWKLSHTEYTTNKAYMVNAIYKPDSNSIFIPLAYIQQPFINLSGLGFEYNLAYFGFTLAHELSHSLDSNGSNYDINGNLFNWWTDADKKKYKKIQDKINLQYLLLENKNNNFYPEKNITENIADIMGLYICEKYLIDYYQIKELPNVVIKEKLIDFYVFYAYQMKSIMSKYTMKMLTRNNIHSLNEYRVNVPLSRSPYFKAIYKIKKGDKMYYPDSEPIF